MTTVLLSWLPMLFMLVVMGGGGLLLTYWVVRLAIRAERKQ